MPMMIKQIREYLPYQGYTNTYNAAGSASTDNPYYYNVPAFSIRAVEFSNLQIYAYSTTNHAILKVRGETLLDTTSSGTTVVEFNFDGNLNPVDVVSTSFIMSTAGSRSDFRTKLANLASNKFFAILSTGINTFEQIDIDALLAIDAICGTVITSTNMTMVAVGFNKNIIDSMWNGNDKFASSQVYVNGKNKSLTATVKVSSTINTSVRPFQPSGTLTTISLPNTASAYAYYQIELSEPTNIDYIIFDHNSGSLNDFIIRDHQITVVDANNAEKIILPPSNALVETKYGSRFYLFDTIPTDYKITGGFESSVSMAGMNAALNRLAEQQSYSIFYDTINASGFNDSIYSKFNKFSNTYPAASTPVGDKIEKADLEPIIRNEERIKYGFATCNAGCSSACFSSSCTVTCSTSCGTRCGTTCSLNCNLACGFTNCTGLCVTACANGCGTTCQGGCAAACAGGTCGTSCISVCIGYCGGTCGYSCVGAACGGSCKGSCAGDYTLGCGLACAGNCTGTCSQGCTGTCGTACSNKTCGNNCYFSCGTGSCNNVCGAACSSGCSSACTGHACIGNCNNGCSKACTIVCSDVCTGSCASNCTGTCINAVSSGTPAYI